MNARSLDVSSGYLPVRENWLARHAEPALDPRRPIIDCHHHLWDRPGWRYLLDEFLADIRSGHNVVGTVYVQARAMHRAVGPAEFRPVGETEFANGVAAMAASGTYGPVAVCAGLVGFADLSAGARVRDVLEAHLRAGGGRFRGVRQITAWSPDPALHHASSALRGGLMSEPAFQEGFATLAPLGLSFDAWLFHPQLEELIELAQAFPDTTIVLDHLGTPLGIGPWTGLRREVFDAWAGCVRRLGQCPNVAVKIGGLGMHANGFGFAYADDPPTSAILAEAWRPYFEICVRAFGPARCMFESNFPVDKSSYSYGVFWNACKLMSAGFTGDEQDDLFGGTAKRVYRLDGAG